jgi:signal transduction histidine kinase
VTGRTTGTFCESVDRSILDAYLAAVQDEIPGLAEANTASLARQAQRILCDARGRLDRHGHTEPEAPDSPPAAPPEPAASPAPATDAIGTTRALTGVHPSRSLQAAGVLLRIALPRLIAQYEDDFGSADTAAEPVALALYTAVTDRLVAASVSYFEVVLDRLNSGHVVERRRISRDLHDRTSHGIGAALQGVDLALLQIENGNLPDVDRLAITRHTLLETLNDVRAMSSLLRDVVGDRTLFEALGEYVDAHTPPGLHVRMQEEGEATRHVRGLVVEESYLVLREAVRNCFLHSAATQLDISLRLDDGWLVAGVTDDGRGFEPADVLGRRTVGLASMRERAEAVGGTVGVTSSGAGGVQVVLRVPVASVFPRVAS